MLKVFVDSGSSIKQDEKEKYGVEIIPLRLLINDIEYSDGVDLSTEDFYSYLIDDQIIPKTSLPAMGEWEEVINDYTQNGDEVIIVTISSKISGTYNYTRMLFEDNPKVKVIDSRIAVGGIRLIVEEINRHKEKTLDEIEKIINDFIQRIKCLAVPETLDYLVKNGRLSRPTWLVGTLLGVKPVITFDDGVVKAETKKRGLKHSIEYIVESLDKLGVDESYPIVASYTYDKTNLERLIASTPDRYKKLIATYDNLTSAIASHWGPNAFGYVFVCKNQNI